MERGEREREMLQSARETQGQTKTHTQRERESLRERWEREGGGVCVCVCYCVCVCVCGAWNGLEPIDSGLVKIHNPDCTSVDRLSSSHLLKLQGQSAKNGILAVSDLESHHRARGNCPWVFWDPLLHIKLGFAANPLFARGRGSTATKTVEKWKIRKSQNHHRKAQIFNHA